MALYATNRFPGDGTTTSYEFNFVGKYIDRSHVKVYQEDNATRVRTPVSITDGNFLNDTTLRDLPVTPVGSNIVIYRDTPKPPLVDFVNGSRFTEYNMDLVARQGLFVAMEALDAGDAEARQQLLDALAVATSLVADAEAAVSDATQAALEAAASAAGAAGYATQAEAARVAAVAARNAAQASAGNAATSATDAATSATNAGNSATAAAGSASAASTSASNAATSASNATAQAGLAGGYAVSASNSANLAATSEANAANSATDAEAAQLAAEAAKSAAAASALSASASATLAQDAKVGAEAAREALLNDLASTATGKGAELVAFKQGGTYAVATTVQAKLREFVSVKDFGAVGDGVTDDTAAIQDALNESSGKILMFPEGVYAVSDTLVVKTETTMHGDGGRASVIKLLSSFNPASELLRNETQTGSLNAYYDQNIEIKNLGFDGNNNVDRTGSLLSFGKVLGLIVDNCSFKDSSYSAIAIGANKNVWVTNSSFVNMGRPRPSVVSAPAIWCDSGAWGTPYDINVVGNYFKDNQWSAAYFMPTGGLFADNYCENNGESTVFSNSNGSNIRYVNNYINGATRSNISACGIETGASSIVISGNIINGCGDSGIAMTDVDSAIVCDNIITNNGIESAYYTQGSGIAIHTTNAAPNMPKNIRIHGNRIADRQAVKTQFAGIAIGGSGDAVIGVAIHDNDLKDQKTHTIYIQSGKLGDGSYTKDNIDKTGKSYALRMVQFQVAGATGNQSITGVGFRPRAIEILATIASGTQSYQSIGTYDGVNANSNITAVDASGRSGGIASGAVIRITDSGGTTLTDASLVSFDIDGFTINNSVVTARPWCIAKCYP